MHHRVSSHWRFPAFLAILSLVACKDDGDVSDDSGGADDSSFTPECAEDGECSGWEICEAQLCVDGDRNNAVEEAESLLWEVGVTGYIQSEGDQDFFQFQAEGGEFVRISTQPLPEENEDFDTIVSLYTPTGQLHMQEDDHAVGSVNTYDTVMYAYLPDAGTWTVIVEDINGAGDPAFQYELLVRESGGHTRETDSLDDPSYNLEVTNAGSIWAVGVALEAEDDVDYIELELPWEECPVTLRGSQFTSGTDAVATVELYDVDGQRLLRKEGLGPEGGATYFEVNGGGAVLAVSDARGGGGDDFWTFVFVSVDERGYSYPQEEEDNGLLELSNVLDVEWGTNNDGTYGVSLVWGVIDPYGDEDYFTVDVDDGMYLSALGSADAFGSLLDAELQILDPTGQVIASETEGNDTFPDLYDLGPLDAGQYTVRVVSEDENAEGLDQFYRLSIYQTDYELAGN
ncbi:MAG: hypothetical protein H6741_30050 [Alphaproteobacteria bacterium]|nr:hypothetical protein [Alphaproteobacteria bacterium]